MSFESVAMNFASDALSDNTESLSGQCNVMDFMSDTFSDATESLSGECYAIRCKGNAVDCE
jgi:hypothetical protein